MKAEFKSFFIENTRLVYALSALVVAGLLWWVFPPGKFKASHAAISFNEEIRPILNENCLVCHGGVRQAGGFSLLFAEDAAKPNDSGKPAFIPGNPDSSELLLRVRHSDPEERMPLDHPPLSGAEIEVLERWIAAGAAWETHWAYVPPAVETPARARRDRWSKNGIDVFVHNKLRQAGLQPAPEAGCSTLVRRVALDLTGLPPTFEEAAAFCADLSPDAYEQVVDALLASPRYGERWAAMWLDLARYADSKGYEKDGPRTIWKYRDWVIDAFNRDLPFDQFTIEQLAGDLLPEPDEAQLLATAFHRNTMNNDEGGTDDEEFRMAAVIDRVNTTWEVWMGTTMACVQCHSHPYDPFTQKEYYEFLAFFNNTADRDTPDEFPTLTTFADAHRGALDTLIDRVTAAEGTADNPGETYEIRQLHALYPRKRLFAGESDLHEGVNIVGQQIGSVEHNSYIAYEDVDLNGVDELSVEYSSAGAGGYVDIHLDARNGPRVGRVYLDLTGGWEDFEIKRFAINPLKGRHDVYFRFTSRSGENSLFNIRWLYFHDSVRDLTADERNQLLAWRDSLQAITFDARTPILQELTGEDRRATHLLDRGSFLDPLEAVQPGVPGVMPALPAHAPENRLTLAKWIVSEDNPLTARVIVNRFWEQIFGAGIIETTEDFGTQGAEASHPELLDWLALQFIHEHNWSVKSLLKQIVMSATYRQAYEGTPQKLARDPDNALLSRGPRIRLTAEQIRDQALFVSGLLSTKMYGPSVYPYQPEGIWNAPYSSMQWETSEGEDRYRRGVYTYWRRSAPYPSMVAFDSPSREFCVSRRIATNTPLQALVTLNDPVFVEAAEALARRAMQAAPENIDGQIIGAFKRALVREPLPAELTALRALYKDAYFDFEDQTPVIEAGADVEKSWLQEPEFAAMAVVANAIMNLDEFIMKG